jgi:hypothetical protein
VETKKKHSSKSNTTTASLFYSSVCGYQNPDQI